MADAPLLDRSEPQHLLQGWSKMADRVTLVVSAIALGSSIYLLAHQLQLRQVQCVTTPRVSSSRCVKSVNGVLLLCRSRQGSALLWPQTSRWATLLSPTGPMQFPMFLALCCWQLWKRRNGVIFRNRAKCSKFYHPVKKLRCGATGCL